MQTQVGVYNSNNDTRAIGPDDCEIATMGRTGDVKTIWNPANADELAHARETFDGLRKKGFLAFRVVDKDGSKGEQMTEFDPNAKMMIMVPPMQGG